MASSDTDLACAFGDMFIHGGANHPLRGELMGALLAPASYSGAARLAQGIPPPAAHHYAPYYAPAQPPYAAAHPWLPPAGSFASFAAPRFPQPQAQPPPRGPFQPSPAQYPPPASQHHLPAPQAPGAEAWWPGTWAHAQPGISGIYGAPFPPRPAYSCPPFGFGGERAEPHAVAQLTGAYGYDPHAWQPPPSGREAHGRREGERVERAAVRGREEEEEEEEEDDESEEQEEGEDDEEQEEEEEEESGRFPRFSRLEREAFAARGGPRTRPGATAGGARAEPAAAAAAAELERARARSLALLDELEAAGAQAAAAISREGATMADSVATAAASPAGQREPPAQAEARAPGGAGGALVASSPAAPRPSAPRAAAVAVGARVRVSEGGELGGQEGVVVALDGPDVIVRFGDGGDILHSRVEVLPLSDVVPLLALSLAQ